jgi:hypothetical protein
MARYTLTPTGALAALLVITMASPLAAQGASSLAEVYAKECPKNADTPVCDSLRKALIEELTAKSRKPSEVTTVPPVAATAPPTQTAGGLTPDELHRRWGIFADRIGRTYFGSSPGFGYSIDTYSWKVPGEILTESSRYATKTAEYKNNKVETRDWHWDAKNGGFYTDSFLGPAYYAVQPDGSVLYSNPDGKHRTRILANGPDSWVSITEELKKGAWKPMAYGTSHHYETTPKFIASLRGNSGGGGGGGLFGALGGAMLGAMAGGNTSQVVGAAMKGAAIVDPNAAALGSVGDSLITGNTASVGGMGNLANTGGGGSYPTRPNALNGSPACSMMNEGNYRTVAVSGGNDVQLKTMCGQAFEYYHMYKNAIAQGYSEADANRTYAAHQGAAQNAISFYQNNR